MAAEITAHYKRPDADTIYIEDEEITTMRDDKACCVCNSNNTLCLAEQGYTHFGTSMWAQIFAYFKTS